MELQSVYLVCFFASSPNQPDIVDTTNYVQSLKSAMLNLQPTPPRPVNNPSFHVDPALYSQSHVFIRQDSVRKPLQQPYNGPYKVISRTKEHFTIDVNGRQEIVSVDRLKPAFIITPPSSAAFHSPTPTLSPTPKVTRSGHRVHFPDRLTY